MSPTCRWTASPEEAQAASARLAELMLLSPDYISHSEIQWGLSPDGRRWADDAADRLSGYLAWVRRSPDAQLAVAVEGDATLGVAVVTWEEMPGRIATVMDIAVEPSARDRGVGAALLAFAEAEAAARGCRWLFLESGVRNTRAHAFFEREGFAPVSHTFAKPLTREAGA